MEPWQVAEIKVPVQRNQSPVESSSFHIANRQGRQIQPWQCIEKVDSSHKAYGKGRLSAGQKEQFLSGFQERTSSCISDYNAN
jgi:hypothetical protein